MEWVITLDCPECGAEYVADEHTDDEDGEKVRLKAECLNCDVVLYHDTTKTDIRKACNEARTLPSPHMNLAEWNPPSSKAN